MPARTTSSSGTAAKRIESSQGSGKLEGKLGCLQERSGQSGNPEDVAGVVALWTGIPVTQIAQEESQRLLHLEEVLHKRVIGQEEAVSAIAKAIRRSGAGLRDPKRPIGSFNFCRPYRRRQNRAGQSRGPGHVWG